MGGGGGGDGGAIREFGRLVLPVTLGYAIVYFGNRFRVSLLGENSRRTTGKGG